MKRIFDPALLDFYLQKHEIPSLFDTPDLAFSLYQFEKGERLDTLNPEEYLSFLVDGSIEISANRADGTSYPIGYLDGFTCIGDMEFCGKRDDTHQIEARTTALCIVLPLASTKELLLNDNRFLRYLLNSVTEKLMLYSSSQSNFSTLEESFLSYLSERCPDQTFSGVEKMAMQLHCSRRQLQRVLKKLLEEGQLVKLSKGSYRLSRKRHRFLISTIPGSMFRSFPPAFLRRSSLQRMRRSQRRCPSSPEGRSPS